MHSYIIPYDTYRLVSEVLANCIKKFRISAASEDCGILLAPSPIRPNGKWLNNDRSLQEEGIQTNVCFLLDIFFPFSFPSSRFILRHSI